MVMGTTDSKCTQRNSREIHEAQSLTHSKDVATFQSAQPVQDNAMFTNIANTNTILSASTFRPAQPAQENVYSTTVSSPNVIAHTSTSQSAQQIGEDAMSASLAPLKNVPYALASQSAQLVQEKAGHTPLPPFDSIPFAWKPLAGLDGGPSTTPARPEAASLNSNLSRRQVHHPRRRHLGRHPDPAIAQILKHIENWEQFQKYLNRHIIRHRNENPNLLADYKQKEWDSATAEIEKLENQLAPLLNDWKFNHNYNFMEGSAAFELKQLASKLKMLRKQATRTTTRRQSLLRELASLSHPLDQHDREYSLGRRIGRYTAEQNRLRLEMAEVDASIKELEARNVNTGENGDTKMRVDWMLNPVVEGGEDSKMEDAAKFSTGDGEGEVEKLTARVAEL